MFQPENYVTALGIIVLVLFVIFLLFLPDPTVLPNP